MGGRVESGLVNLTALHRFFEHQNGPRLYRHPAGEAYSASPHRFNTVHAGRRSSKTLRLKVKVARAAYSGESSFRDPHYFLAAPTRDQAKRIFWQHMKNLIPPPLRSCKPSETELVISVINGASVHIIGLDVAERMEGSPWDGGGITEFPNVKEDAWRLHIRPALSDRGGWCDLEGVPEGRNHFYTRVQSAQAETERYKQLSEWGSFHWHSAEVLPAAEIEAARNDLDLKSFQQEYEADFVSFQGKAYYVWLTDVHAKHRLRYSDRRPLILALDFNVSPGVAAIGQEQRLPNGEEGTGWIDEIWIERDSNTPRVMKEFIKRYGQHRGQLHVYGDATGGMGGTAKLQGSDWELVIQYLKPVFLGRFKPMWNRSNPNPRARVNAVNSRLCSAAGIVRMMVDPVKCPYLVRDFEGVDTKDNGELDKDSDKMLSHLSDGVGYFTHVKFPIHGGAVSSAPLNI